MNEISQVFTNDEFGTVRVIMQDNEPWFVGKDVAKILGYAKTRNAISRHVDSEDRKEAPFQGSLGGIQEMTVINESGLYSLIFGSTLPKAKSFKRWVTSEVLPSIRKSGSYSVKQKTYTVVDAIYLIGDVAKAVEGIFGVRHGIALAKGMDVSTRTTGFDLEPLRDLLPPATHKTGKLNPTQIGKTVGLSAIATNKILEELGFQAKSAEGWRLLGAGTDYGEEMPYTKNGHSGYQILWNEDVVDAIRRKMQ